MSPMQTTRVPGPLMHECTFGPMRTLRTEIMADLNRLLLTYRSNSTLHRHLGTTFKRILTTISNPARVWTETGAYLE